MHGLLGLGLVRPVPALQPVGLALLLSQLEQELQLLASGLEPRHAVRGPGQ